MGGEKYSCNHSFYGYYDRFWKKNPKCPELFVAAHPDWFAQGYSANELKGLGGRPPQMCFSSQGFIDQVVADAGSFSTARRPRTGAKRRASISAWCRWTMLVVQMPACQAQLTRDRNQQAVQQRDCQRLFLHLRQQGGPRSG